MTENWPVAPLDVNPAELSAAGQELAGDGNGLVAALSALTAGLSGVNPGEDPLGQEFARGYRRSGGGLLKAGAAAVSAAQRLAYGIRKQPGRRRGRYPATPCARRANLRIAAE